MAQFVGRLTALKVTRVTKLGMYNDGAGLYGIAARALEFLILTATRTGGVIGARPGEIKDKVWTVPAGRMKDGKEHRTSLSAAALAIVEAMKAEHGGEFLFPGCKHGKPLSNMAMLVLLDRMKRSDLTAHGFRSIFCGWAAERTNYPRAVAEMTLARAIDCKVEAAYRRGDLFEKRVALMDEWAQFCALTKGAAGGQVLLMQKANSEAR